MVWKLRNWEVSQLNFLWQMDVNGIVEVTSNSVQTPCALVISPYYKVLRCAAMYYSVLQSNTNTTTNYLRAYSILQSTTTNHTTPYYKVWLYMVLPSYRFTLLPFYLASWRFTILPFHHCTVRLGAKTFYCFSTFPFYSAHLCLGNTVSRKNTGRHHKVQLSIETSPEHQTTSECAISSTCLAIA